MHFNENSNSAQCVWVLRRQTQANDNREDSTLVSKPQRQAKSHLTDFNLWRTDFVLWMHGRMSCKKIVFLTFFKSSFSFFLYSELVWYYTRLFFLIWPTKMLRIGPLIYVYIHRLILKRISVNSYIKRSSLHQYITCFSLGSFKSQNI